MMRRCHFLALAFLLLAPAIALYGDDMATQHELIDFSDPGGRQWYTVNDGVMGGLSSCQLVLTDRGTGIFSGEISLANNGGFASVRTVVGPLDLSPYSGLEIRARGDGRTYQLRLRQDDRFDGIAYRAIFETRKDEWITVRLAFDDFQPTFRGRILDDVSALDPSKIAQLVFMLADKQPGSFALEIEGVRVWPAK